jgi:ABC-type microcin C transport system permease subunit YejB
MLPAWLVLPLCALTLGVIAWHVTSVHRSNMPSLRKRVRVASGVLMMFITSLLGYALGIARLPEHWREAPGESKAFVIIWIAIVGLLLIVVVLAVFDAMMTAAAGAVARRQLYESVLRHRAEDAESRESERG